MAPSAARTTGVAVGNGIASDTFGRTVAGGWGSADVGGPWLVAGSAANYAVSGGTASIRVAAGSGPSAILRDVSSNDTDLAVVVHHGQADDGFWSVRVARGTTGPRCRRLPGEDPAAPQRCHDDPRAAGHGGCGGVGPDDGAGDPGPDVRARVAHARAGAGHRYEPHARTGEGLEGRDRGADRVAGQRVRRDGGIPGQGSGGLASYLSSNATNAPITLVVDDLVASSTAPPPPVNTPPTPAFAWSAHDLTVVLDATGSSDPEGPISSYAWDYGDGVTGSGATAEHSYAAAGAYAVSLTVTDSGGLSRSTSRTVTVTAPPPPNTPPTASFTVQVIDRAVSVDANASSDAEGALSSYAWSFGDGASASGVTSSHGYAADGTYVVTLTVTDSGGLTATATRTVVVLGGPPPDGPPTAAFAVSASGLDISGDASASTDQEGPISSYAWDFGDATTGSGSTVSHSYAAAGTYVVTLVVTDSAGATASVTQPVTVSPPPPPNTPPTASFTASSTDLKVAVDAASSSDAEGPIASYVWDFGDGTTGSGVTATRTFAAPGTYTVTLTVADVGGLTATTSRQVTATAPPNTPPQASFTAAVAGSIASVDGRASTDAEGPIASYAWTFGDGSTGVGATTQRAYAAAGTYTVTLTVTDAAGATATTSRSVTVAAPSTVRAADEFARTVAGGWGTADVGGPWTISGTASNFAVANGVGTLRVAPGTGPTAFLRSVSSSDNDMSLTLSADQLPGGSGLHLSATGRRVTGAGDYRAKVKIQANGTTSILVQRVSSTNVETSLAPEVVVPAAAYTAGTKLRVRLLVTGTSPTTVRAKVWKVGSAEPAWQVTATDATAGFQAAGQVGLVAYLSSAAGAAVTVSVDSLDVRASTP